MKKKMLILGGTGLIGSTLAVYSKNLYDIHLTTHENTSDNNFVSSKLDLIKERSKISLLIKDVNPDVVVHTVAYPSVDFCETNFADAKLLHVDISKDVSITCNDIDSKLIYFSTDAVFDGKSTKKYTENDLPNPLSKYGETKLCAEKVIKENCKKNIILRTTVVYGWHERSRFTNWVLNNLKNNKTINAFTDQNNTPTLVDDLSLCILKILEKNIFGLYNAAGKTCLSRYDFALKIAELFNLNKKLIIPTISLGKQLAPRPINGCLDMTKLEQMIDFDFSNIADGIDFLRQQSMIKNDL
jgi:dTDP-4-dehydrorhamnose reductase